MRGACLDQNAISTENRVSGGAKTVDRPLNSGEMKAIVDDIELIGPETERTTAAEATRLSFSMAARNGFFQRIINGARKNLPDELARFHAKPGFDLVKIWYDNERIHYEAAIDLHREHIEIALHFEDGPVSTAIYLRAFDAEILAVKHELGHTIELERWTQSWGRVFELTPLTTLDAKTGEWAAQRMVAFITELQPILECTYAAPERSAQPRSTAKYHWGGKSRRSRP
jgi:hypothetical protein